MLLQILEVDVFQFECVFNVNIFCCIQYLGSKTRGCATLGTACYQLLAVTF